MADLTEPTGEDIPEQRRLALAIPVHDAVPLFELHASSLDRGRIGTDRSRALSDRLGAWRELTFFAP